MAVIDADAHVVEWERTWDYMNEGEREFAPHVMVFKDPKRKASGRANEYWMIGGRVFAKDGNIGRDIARERREAEDIEARLAHMDELGVDTQVLYPSLFLRTLTPLPHVDTALCRSYNRWLADIWKSGKGRLRWVVVPPLHYIDKAIAELNFGKENGACGVFIRGVEGDKLPTDPYFFPLYEEASRLNLPICVHASQGNLEMFDVFGRGASLAQFKFGPINLFATLIASPLPQKFPDLRWAFVELSAEWLPYVMNHVEIGYRRKGKTWAGRDLLKENRIYVACQTSDDLPYILEHVGDDHLVIGTDYGHNDTASEIDALRKLKADGKIPGASIDKILGDNAAALYGL
ncbi:MAG TPA: amidohydrolase family protein [Verrucomicrobiae bacterium]|jgi:predicted TIM-barrel fold metal-dependent hydrolase|nr:amidohydrolase family protein [Verrucomicrobiae bacterium]